MQTFDLVLAVLIAGFSLFGLWFGFVHTLGSLLGTVIGAYLASRWYEPVAQWIIHMTGWSENATRVVVFIGAFIIINRLVGFVFWIADKFLSIITRLPFIKSINHLLGLLLGLVEGLLTIGLILYFIERYPLSQAIMARIGDSQVAPLARGVAEVLIPLLPMAIRALETGVEFVEKKVL